MTAIGYIIGYTIALGVLAFCVIIPALDSRTRRRVIDDRTDFLARLEWAKKLVLNPKVKEPTRKRFGRLEKAFAPIGELEVGSRNVHWHEVLYNLDALSIILDEIISTMSGEIEPPR